MSGKDTGEKVLVIGGGPAGLAATYILAQKEMPVCCYEADSVVGGISRTIEYKGFRFDIGGHRFFSKYDRVNALWEEILGDEFLTRPRLSRIYYNGKFFQYPLQIKNAFFGLGVLTSLRIFGSYLKYKLRPLPEEETFDQWVTNRFGAVLYEIFFKTYTEKVWGTPCEKIKAEWAAQRIKGLSLYSAIKNALPGISRQKEVIKTLIDSFQYPRLGPGQMYETMARKAEAAGARIQMRHRVQELRHQEGRIVEAQLATENGAVMVDGTDFISTMPITELIRSLRPLPPQEVLQAADALRYRSLLTVNLLLDCPQQLPDTWLYIHAPSVRMGRVQCFANWSPFMVPDEKHSSLGLEYFCNEGDSFWSRADSELINVGMEEIERLRLANKQDVMDSFVVRMAKCYPVYDDQYEGHLRVIREYLRKFSNLQLCGRYGLFKYNNMDHSILTALLAVENILGAHHDVWSINADDTYHEERAG